MLTSPDFREAFDLSREPSACASATAARPTARAACSRGGWSRRACKFVTSTSPTSSAGPKGGWDTHGFNDKPMYPILNNYLLPITDQTLPTLLEDLDDRGLLDDTLVVWMGEFGRSPRINNIAGRDHWPQCYTVMAGGGVKRGYVHGSSDQIGAYPSRQCGPKTSRRRCSPAGHRPGHRDPRRLNRPLPISGQGDRGRHRITRD